MGVYVGIFGGFGVGGYLGASLCLSLAQKREAIVRASGADDSHSHPDRPSVKTMPRTGRPDDNEAHEPMARSTPRRRCVMVGVDGSSRAAAASEWAARLSMSTGAELVVVSAWQPSQAEGTPEDFTRRRAEAQSLLEGPWCDPARGVGAVPRSLFLDGPPDVILDAATAKQADLIVVGNRGAGGFATLHIGSVAHHLAHHTTRPLAIVPAPHAAADLTTIVVGIDGSQSSAAALAWCTTVAVATGASVTAVWAFEPFLEWVPETDPKSWRRRAEREMAEWVEPLRDRSIAVETLIVEDIHPVAALAHTASDRSADLIVVGAHELRSFMRVRLGGIALQLIHRIGVPVVLVPDVRQPASSSDAADAPYVVRSA